MYYYINIILWVILILTTTKIYIKLTTGCCKSKVCLVGKTVIITGANGGIGYETAADFAKRGAKVILACRDPNRGRTAVEKIIIETENPNVFFKHLDLSSFKSVRQFTEDIKKSENRLDILVNNAGVAVISPEETEDGLLLLMQVNYFGPFLLTNLLLELIKKTPNARIINVSSIIANFAFNFDVNGVNYCSKNILEKCLFAYARSKLCKILFTIELAERLKDTSVTVYSLHPGVVPTGIFNGFVPLIKELWMHVLYLFFKDAVEGAQTTIYCSIAKGIEHLSGQHFQDCRIVSRYKTARDPDRPKKLWDISEKLVKLS